MGYPSLIQIKPVENVGAIRRCSNEDLAVSDNVTLVIVIYSIQVELKTVLYLRSHRVKRSSREQVCVRADHAPLEARR